MTQLSVFTDGACLGNQYGKAKGGYGVTITSNGQRVELSQGYQDTTNNRMELRAVIAALLYLPPLSQVTVYTDSQYITNAFNHDWLKSWQDNGWRTSNRKPVRNYDLWQELLQAQKKHTVKWVWVQGHNGNAENERVDKLAGMAARSNNLITDSGPTRIPVASY